MYAASSDGWDEVTKDRYSGRVTPEWSPNKDAKVHRMFLSCVDSMIKARGEQPSLMDTIVYLTGVRLRFLFSPLSTSGSQFYI